MSYLCFWKLRIGKRPKGYREVALEFFANYNHNHLSSVNIVVRLFLLML